MSISKFLSSLLYNPAVNKISIDSINQKLNSYQATLEDLGFATKRADQTVFFTPGQLLTATRDKVVLEISLDVTGFEYVSMALQVKDYFSTVPMRLKNFDHALTIVGAKETEISVQDKKIA
jgi:hypothetical protein